MGSATSITEFVRTYYGLIYWLLIIETSFPTYFTIEVKDAAFCYKIVLSTMTTFFIATLLIFFYNDIMVAIQCLAGHTTKLVYPFYPIQVC